MQFMLSFVATGNKVVSAKNFSSLNLKRAMTLSYLPHQMYLPYSIPQVVLALFHGHV